MPFWITNIIKTNHTGSYLAKIFSRQTRKTCLLSRQTYACRDKTFVTTNICNDKHNFVATNTCLSRQNYASIIFVATNTCLSRQIFYCDKHDFVATSILLLRQRTCFVGTKMILLAAPANDIL